MGYHQSQPPEEAVQWALGEWGSTARRALSGSSTLAYGRPSGPPSASIGLDAVNRTARQPPRWFRGRVGPETPSEGTRAHGCRLGMASMVSTTLEWCRSCRSRDTRTAPTSDGCPCTSTCREIDRFREHLSRLSTAAKTGPRARFRARCAARDSDPDSLVQSQLLCQLS